MKVKLRNPSNGLTKQCPVGFSVTTLFFGFFVPVARGWFGYAAISVLVAMVTFGLSWLVYPFIINRHYVRHLIEKGYQPISERDLEIVRSMGIEYDPPETLREVA